MTVAMITAMALNNNNNDDDHRQQQPQSFSHCHYSFVRRMFQLFHLNKSRSSSSSSRPNGSTMQINALLDGDKSSAKFRKAKTMDCGVSGGGGGGDGEDDLNHHHQHHDRRYESENRKSFSKSTIDLSKSTATMKNGQMSFRQLGQFAKRDNPPPDSDTQTISIPHLIVRNGVEVKTVSASVGKKGSNYMKEISYTNEKMIGNGSFGVVYQATLVDENEVVAIKRVLQDRRFKNRELNIMVTLEHCNIVRLKYYFYTYKNQPKEDIYLNLVLEFIPDTVSKVARYYMRQGQKMPYIYIKLYMYQLFRSLAYIHTQGICHRDIKPQNLLVNPMTGVLKLCDFGSAKHLVRGEMNVSYICSRYYRAPELIFGATDYTTKIDIWSAGCVFAELLLGYPIFSGESGVDQLVEIIKVLGTPSKEQIRRMNRHYTEFKFPKISASPWERVFGNRIGSDVTDLVSKLLDYTPFMRLDPLKACTHRFFDELRNPACKLSNDKELPALFNFTNQELKMAPDLNAALIPQHLHSQFTQYLTHSQDTLDSGVNISTSAAGSGGDTPVSNQSADSKSSTTAVTSSTSSSSSQHNARFNALSSPNKQPHNMTSSTFDSTAATDALDATSSGAGISSTSMQSNNATNDTSSISKVDAAAASSPATASVVTTAAAASSVVTN